LQGKGLGWKEGIPLKIGKFRPWVAGKLSLKIGGYPILSLKGFGNRGYGDLG